MWQLMKANWEYYQDFWERSILFTNALFERGNNYLKHRINKSPVFAEGYSYTTIKDGRSCKKPTNYDLIKIHPKPGLDHHPCRRPILIIDPRAGHGPGIGGFKMESEVGMALKFGHPVYFAVFHPEPIKDQTLADVRDAEAEFLEEIVCRHEGVPYPAVIGNCQAGWASALLAASKPNLISTLIMAGAPLSYWAGEKGKNPMRYRGGLLGGSWIVSYLADLSQGNFDGAHLVDGFERLNLANTFWQKAYNVFANIDREKERFLGFEKWWGGFFFTTSQEMEQIVQDLFIGNKLEKGEMVLREGEEPIDLKKIDSNIVVFASEGDNITPPSQALQWIPAVYHDAQEIKDMNRRIIYCIHPSVGHLGIFVAGAIAAKEHKAIIGGLRDIDKLSPGLYELVIEPNGVFYQERDFSDLEKYGISFDDYSAFEKMSKVSDFNQFLYEKFCRPIVKRSVSPITSLALKFSHPLRVKRYFFSCLNPAYFPVQLSSILVEKNRVLPNKNNLFNRVENFFSNMTSEILHCGGNLRDAVQENTFWEIYD